ncbi:hypothetical protein [Nocardioides coralli]|uniref:hypothetical protein n=1 Tax=Nocardioides coralli TaxID=2872154 RepID=UPI001CA3901E|nr:hypothetical protein [Nocardioides coralli]QZY30495.1 hypothetical protein K6T13_07570 [Nocardioides coralli]
MIGQWIALAGTALVALGLTVALVRLRGRTRREVAAARAEAAELRERLERLERLEGRERPAVEAPTLVTGHEFRITRVGEPEPEEAPPPQLERAVFADLLLRESVIRVGSLAHGVRRALSAESRNRIGFEMKREVRRARKQRRLEQRLAWREWQARERSRVSDDELQESA